MSVRAAHSATDAAEIAEGASRRTQHSPERSGGSRSGGSRSGGSDGRGAARAALALLVAACIAETLVFVWLGRSLIDEGVFLNAGRRVSEGAVPYRDFPWSQGPTLPYLLALLTALFGTSLLAARLLAWLGCLTSIGASAWIAGRFGGAWAALLALLLAMTNIPTLWVSTTLRTQALSTPLVMLAAAALARAPQSVLGWAAAPSLLLWATGIRLTDGLAFAAVCAFTAWQLRGQAGVLLRVAGWVGAQALLVLLPVLRSPGDAWFHVVTSPLGRGARSGAAPMDLADKLGFYLDPSYGHRTMLLLAAALVLALALGRARGRRGSTSLPVADPVSAQLALVALALLVFVPHLALSHVYLTYAVTSSMLLLTAVAIALGAWLRGARRRRWVPALAIGVALLAVFANASQRWGTFVGRGESGLGHLRTVGRTLGILGGEDCSIATLQSHLAAASGCRLVPGLEYSLFSFFRDMGDAEAETLGVLNPALLDRRIATAPPELIAVSRQDALRMRARRQPPVGVHPLLEFVPSSAFEYNVYGPVEIASGVRLPGMSDTLRVMVFVRKDRVRASGVGP